jgi:hypothetical protein
MSEPGRPRRDEALLSKLDRTMDSILATNAEIAFRPKFHPRYGVARLVAWFTALLGWAVVLGGLVGLALKLGIGSIDEFADLVDWIAVPWTAGVTAAGLVVVNIAALTRGSLDGADYQRQLLQIAMARAVKGIAKSRTAKSVPPATPKSTSQLADELVEPRIE